MKVNGNPFKRLETTAHVFHWRDVAIALIKAKGLHEGLWRVGMRFDLRAANVNIGKDLMVPGAFLPVLDLNLTQVKQADPLTVDAAEVNPESRIYVPGNN